MTQDVPATGRRRTVRRLRNFVGDTIWRDAGYWLTLIGRYLRAQPLAGGVTLLALIGGNIFVNFMSIRLVITTGKLTDALISHHHAAHTIRAHQSRTGERRLSHWHADHPAGPVRLPDTVACAFHLSTHRQVDGG